MRGGGPGDIGETAHLAWAMDATACVLPRTRQAGDSGETVGVGVGGGGGAGADAELGQDVEDVALDRSLADREAIGDLPVGAAGGDQTQDLQLA